MKKYNTNKEIELFLKKKIKDNDYKSLGNEIRYHSEIKEFLINKTKFLKENVTFRQRLYHWFNDITEIPKCKICNGEVNFNKGEYRDYCSVKCSVNSNEVREKRKKTNLEKYGVENPSQSEKVKEKIKETNLEKYGVENPSQSEKVKEKIKETNLQKFGNQYGVQSEEIKGKIRETNLEKYGVENYVQSKNFKEKAKKTNLKKYGVETPSQSEEIKERVKKTNLKKYGVENPSQSEEIKERVKKTNLKKYGVECTLQNQKVKEKIKETNLKKYGVESILELKEVREGGIEERYKTAYENLKRFKDCVIPLFTKIEYIGNNVKKIYRWKCVKCEKEFDDNYYSGRMPRCLNCFPYQQSQLENDLFNFIKNDLGFVDTIQNSRSIIAPQEIDIFIPTKKIAIEFNGLYWHNEINIDKKYHLNKTEKCLDKDIQLIHIFEDEWLYQRDIVKNRLRHILCHKSVERIYARKCEVVELDFQITQDFLLRNHIQGQDKSKYRYGLLYDNELVGVMTLSKSRFSKKSEFELVRFCTSKSIIGGASKLFKYFIEKHKPNDIITYADRRWSQGKLYDILGFNFSHNSAPNYFYVIKDKRESRIKYQKHKLKNILSIYNPELSEQKNMENNGFYRIWDCGNMVFKWNK